MDLLWRCKCPEILSFYLLSNLLASLYGGWKCVCYTKIWQRKNVLFWPQYAFYITLNYLELPWITLMVIALWHTEVMVGGKEIVLTCILWFVILGSNAEGKLVISGESRCFASMCHAWRRLQSWPSYCCLYLVQVFASMALIWGREDKCFWSDHSNNWYSYRGTFCIIR